MFDAWTGDIELTNLVLWFSILIFLPIQLLLCFKAKRRVFRLLPVTLLCAATLFFVAQAAASTGWDSLGYALFGIFTGLMLLMCGIGWGIWAAANFLKKKNKEKPIE